MSKPTIFFSHSTKDKDLLLPIKKKIDKLTGNSIDIFMSSDGQSLPLGRNWIHKLEEGLKAAQIMFVFVTPESVHSSWLYFEAGFAYARDIQVIPVGIGISVDELRPPLNLLQGYNVTSGDSLNNFVSVINDCESDIGVFRHKNGLKFKIYDNIYKRENGKEYGLGIGAENVEFSMEGIQELLDTLFDSSVVFQKD